MLRREFIVLHTIDYNSMETRELEVRIPKDCVIGIMGSLHQTEVMIWGGKSIYVIETPQEVQDKLT